MLELTPYLLDLLDRAKKSDITVKIQNGESVKDCYHTIITDNVTNRHFVTLNEDFTWLYCEISEADIPEYL